MKKFFTAFSLILIGVVAGFFARPVIVSWSNKSSSSSFSKILHFQCTGAKICGLTATERENILGVLTDEEFIDQDEQLSAIYSKGSFIVFKKNNDVEFIDNIDNLSGLTYYYEKEGNNIHIYQNDTKRVYLRSAIYSKTENETTITIQYKDWHVDTNQNSWIEVIYTLRNQ